MSETILNGLSEENLLSRAIRSARCKTRNAPRWLAVSDVFVLKQSDAKELCRIFGFDPHERAR